ncbi:MAG: hypothetical protein HWE30_11690 [Methylocystaceae bacterium]|nr:hypothetical protein [Methylocystaceae bacterium]
MFDFLEEIGNKASDLFSVKKGYSPETPAEDEDAQKTGQAMNTLGYFGKNGESEFALPKSVMAFQQDHNLKVDGKINKGGPTQKAISNALQAKTPQKQQSTEDALKGLLNHNLYQKKDPAYQKYVQKQYKRAYPGDVQYDETGKM